MFPLNGADNGAVPVKRPRSDICEEEMDDNSNCCTTAPVNFWHYDSGSVGRRFLAINASDSVFHSEDFQPKGETLYIPLREDTLINTQSVEQFTFTKGSFFIGDEECRFSRTAQGIALNLWRYDEAKRKLYISRSFLLTNSQVFTEIKGALDRM